MSNLAIVLYDEKASLTDMTYLTSLLNRIVQKINAATKMEVQIDAINDLSVTSADKCDHEFALNKDGKDVRCTKCPKCFPVTAFIK